MDETTKREEQAGLTRRQVLKTAAGAGLILLLPRVQADDAPAVWTAVGKTEEFLKAQPKRVALANGDILFVTRQEAETFAAVSAKCTHRGCEVGWRANQTEFQCPCHGACFDVAGKNVHGTQRQPDEKLPDLPSLPTRLKDGQVEVNLQGIPAADLQPTPT